MPSTDTPTAPASGETLAEIDRLRARRAAPALGTGTVVVVVAFKVLRSNDALDFVSACAIGALLSAVLYGVVVPRGLRHEAAPVRGLIMSVLGLALFFVFFTGAPLVLGGAGALLGFAGKRAPARSGASIAALVVGVLAVIAWVAIVVGDWISSPGVWLG